MAGNVDEEFIFVTLAVRAQPPRQITTYINNPPPPNNHLY